MGELGGIRHPLDLLAHSLDIHHHLTVCKADDSQTIGGENLSPPLVVCLAVIRKMRLAVNLNDQTQSGAVEVSC